MAQIAGQRLETTAPKGQRMQVKLGDGTSVWLNAGSSIAYPPIFAGKERRVRLSGEAIFEVVHDENCPFVVETFACDARVLGTRFDIVADEDAGTFSAALLEGKLQLVNRMSDETVMMTPNEIVRLRHGKLYRQQLSDHDDYLWPEGIISLKGLSFGELMTKLERAFNVRIVTNGISAGCEFRMGQDRRFVGCRTCPGGPAMRCGFQVRNRQGFGSNHHPVNI